MHYVCQKIIRRVFLTICQVILMGWFSFAVFLDGLSIFYSTKKKTSFRFFGSLFRFSQGGVRDVLSAAYNSLIPFQTARSISCTVPTEPSSFMKMELSRILPFSSPPG